MSTSLGSPSNNNDVTSPSSVTSSNGGMLRDPWAAPEHVGGIEESKELPEDEQEELRAQTLALTTSNENATGDDNNNDDDNEKKTPKASDMNPSLTFQPGDHVIRWEMLPIAWPIQIHGIVLSVSDAAVVLVDFGLAAAPGAAGDVVDAEAIQTEAEAINTTTTTATTQEAEEANGGEDTTATSPTASSKSPSWFSSDPKEVEAARQQWMDKSAANGKRIMASFQKLHPTKGKTKKKNRLNVLVLEDPAEWSKWKKVNYDGGGLFGGFGGSGKSDDGQDNQEEQPGDSSQGKKKKWWENMKIMSSKKSTSMDSADDDSTAADSTAAVKISPSSGASKKWWERSSTLGSTVEDDLPEETKDDQAPSKEGWWNKMTTGMAKETQVNGSAKDQASLTSKKETMEQNGAAVSNGNDVGVFVNGNNFKNAEGSTAEAVSPGGVEETKQVEEWALNGDAAKESAQDDDAAGSAQAPSTTKSTDDEVPSTSSFANRNMNPAMAKLMESKKAKDAEASGSGMKGLFGRGGGRLFGKKMADETTPAATAASTTENKESSKPKKKLDLPKADPPKLVLARTRWLLQHGEEILPPYNIFHSNSECIAVFCKTGYWSNIQADVFLHSTAIGNAKSMGMATLGVAASVPLLAPVIAGLGVGMVAAPWLILHSAKKQADELTLKMTDQFWAQAEPEVFVECIEHWSKLDEYYERRQRKPSLQQQQQQQESKTNTTSTESKVNEEFQMEKLSNGASHNGDECTGSRPPQVVSL